MLTMTDTLGAYLAYWDAQFDADFATPGEILHTPGTHTRMPNGTRGHSTRTAMDYATALLHRGSEADVQRARDAIVRVLALQETNPTKREYGIWPWFAEEPLDQMDRIDWNWADFIGARLADMLHDYADVIGDPLRQQMREALHHAALAIFRRNMHCGYTNIAIMGAVVTMAAGELLDEPGLLTYGRQRLANTVDLVKRRGGFGEYNSPCYTVVAVTELERLAHVVHDEQAQRDGQVLRDLLWRDIAEHFHPPTAQWAGPHSRSYSERLDLKAIERLSACTGVSVPAHPSMTAEAIPQWNAAPLLPCPQQWRRHFERLPQSPRVVHDHYIENDGSTTERVTWMNEQVCLGSFSNGSFWTQRRPVIAYWPTPRDPAVVFRLRMLFNGRDFASGQLWTAQSQHRIVSLAGFGLGRGDWHITLDSPVQPVFDCEDLRLRYQLIGEDVHGEELGNGRFALSAGDYRAVIHTLPGWFNDQRVEWALCQEEPGNPGVAAIEAVCHSGGRKPLDLQELHRVMLPSAVEVQSIDEPVSEMPLEVKSLDDQTQQLTWPMDEALQVTAPLRGW